MTPYALAALPDIFRSPLFQLGVWDMPWKMVTDWHHLAHPAGKQLLSVRANTGCSHPSPADGTTQPHVGGLVDRIQSPSHFSLNMTKPKHLIFLFLKIAIIEVRNNFSTWLCNSMSCISGSLSQLAQTTWHESNHDTESYVLKVTARDNACWVVNTPNVTSLDSKLVHVSLFLFLFVFFKILF